MANYSIAGVCYNKYEVPLAKRLKDAIEEYSMEVSIEQSWYIADDDNPEPENFERVKGAVRDWTVERFGDTDILVYIAPVVRVVRYVGKHLVDQHHDPAVVAVDPNGKYCIPVLTGRRGEAYDVARVFDSKLGIEFINAVAPEDATQFDISKYALSNDMIISNTDYAIEVATAIHAGDEVGFNTNYPVIGNLPGGMKWATSGNVGVYISHSYHEAYFKHTLWLIPRCITIGIVCEEKVSFKTLSKFLSDIMKDYSIYPESILRIGTVEGSESIDEIRRIGNGYGVQTIVIGRESAEIYRRIKGTAMDDSELAALKCGGDRPFVKALEDDGMCVSITMKNYYIKF